MHISIDAGTGHYHIKAYEAHFIQVNDQQLTHSLIISPTLLISPWTVSTVKALRAEDFTPLWALKPSIVLLGTGPTLYFPEISISQIFLERKIGLEVMDTPAACRTYTALSAEGRSVAAALLLIKE